MGWWVLKADNKNFRTVISSRQARLHCEKESRPYELNHEPNWLNLYNTKLNTGP